MKDTVKASGDGVPVDEAQQGVFLGLWHRCRDGYAWREDLTPADKKAERGPWLVAASTRSQDYAVLRRKGLLRDLISLATKPTREAITKFAGLYGHLSLSQLLLTPKGIFKRGEALDLWLRELHELAHLSESWSAIDVVEHDQQHGLTSVTAMQRLLRERSYITQNGATVYHAVVRRSEIDLERFGPSLGSCTRCGQQQVEERHTWRLVSPPARASSPGAPVRDLTKDELVRLGRATLAHLISRKLRSHVDVALLEDTGGATVRHAPDSLLAAGYLQLAFRIAGRGPREKECAHCHEPFLSGRRDQQYCTKKCRELAGYYRRKYGDL